MNNLKCPKGHDVYTDKTQNAEQFYLYHFQTCQTCNRPYFEIDCIKSEYILKINDSDLDYVIADHIQNKPKKDKNGSTTASSCELKHESPITSDKEYCQCDQPIFSKRCSVHPDQYCGKPDCKLEWYCVICENSIDLDEFVIIENPYITHFKKKIKPEDKLSINTPKVDKEPKVDCQSSLDSKQNKPEISPDYKQSECEHEFEKDIYSYIVCLKCGIPKIEAWPKSKPFKEQFSDINNRTNQPKQDEDCTNCTCIDKVIDAFSSQLIPGLDLKNHSNFQVNNFLIMVIKKLKELKDE
jgi:hypothetical protein